MRILVRDAGSDPERAAAAVRELAADPDVVAIVGPLDSATCEAAAREAETLEIPLLALTAREDVVNQRAWIFRMRTRPVEEASMLADRAIALGAQRFAILYPDDPYGVGLRSLFWEPRARGGRVGLDPVRPEAPTRDPIRSLVGYTCSRGEKRCSHPADLERARRIPHGRPARCARRHDRSRTPYGRPIPRSSIRACSSASHMTWC